MVRSDMSRLCVVLAVVAVGLASRTAFAEEEAPAKGIPAELKRFQGMMTGKLIEKGDSSIVFKIETIKRVWKGNKAENPKGAVGETISLTLNKVSDHHRKRIMKNFEGLKAGDPIELEAFDLGGDILCIKEWLKKVGEKE